MREQKYIAVDKRTDDGMTNGASNIIRKIQLHDRNRPSGIIWVQFDHTDVGQKTRHNNRCLYVKRIEYTWTPIKPVTAQFAVGRNRTAQVVRKQFPLRPAAAKTRHRSIGVRARSDLGGRRPVCPKNYAVPHCLIVEISYLLPQNVRKNMRLQSLKGIKLYVIETQFLEPHILYVGLLDLVTIE